MKLCTDARLLSFLRATLVVLLPLLLTDWMEQVGAGPVRPIRESLSEPLQNHKTWAAVHEVSRHAQSAQLEDDHNVRLLNMDNLTQDDHLCCLHANILDFYLHNILPYHNGNEQHMQRLQTDLTRVSSDLQTRGCNVTNFEHHQHAVEFRKKLKKIGGPQAINKAVGEVDILFAYLQDFCTQTRNASSI